MSKAVKPVPEGFHTLTPYLCVAGAAQAIEFYKEAFGATELMRMADPGGKIGHAEIQIGDSRVMLADEYPEMGFKSPRAYGGSPMNMHMYVENVDGVVKQAVDAGAKLVRPVEDQFYGDRSGTVEDPFGHQWHVSTHKEDVSEEELHKRAAARAQAQKASAT
jgi:PhnB protein